MKNNWQTKKLGEVCEVIAGQSPEGQYYNNIGKGLPFYQGKKEFRDKFIDAPTTWTTKITKEAKKDDILMSVRAPVGPVNFATEKICIGRGLAAIRASEKIRIDFLFYFLQKFENEIESNTGAVFDSINKNQIENIGLLLPSVSEQKRIIALLDEIFAKIEKAKENTEKNLQNSREILKTFVKQLVTNAHWDIKKFEEVCKNLDSKRIPITKRNRLTGEYPYYGASGIVDYVNNYIFDENLLLVSEDGANLLARTYPIAFSIKGKTWVNNHAHVLKFKNKDVQKFYEYYLNSINLHPYVSGMAQPKLNQSSLNSIKIPQPTMLEQKTIVKKLDELSEQTKKLEEIYTKKLADLDELKKSVLQKAFAGEL